MGFQSLRENSSFCRISCTGLKPVHEIMQSNTYSCELAAVEEPLRGSSPALDWAASTGMRIF
jgi:hypothetical protein